MDINKLIVEAFTNCHWKGESDPNRATLVDRKLKVDISINTKSTIAENKALVIKAYAEVLYRLNS